MAIMNRARFTKRWTLLVAMAIIVYLTLKHEPVTKIGHNGERNNNLRRAAGVSSEESLSQASDPWEMRQKSFGVLSEDLLTRKGLRDELRRMKSQEQTFIANLIKARKTEEELRSYIDRLSQEFHRVTTVQRKSGQSKEQHNILSDEKNLPTVFVVTPTFKRFVQKAELTRISQAFKAAKKLHWIVVEDSVQKTDLVGNFLKSSGLKYTHLNIRTPLTLRRHKKEFRRLKPRGVEQRNLAIEWLRKNINPQRTPGVVYFADDDNTYDSQIFDEMRWIQGVGVWPVAFTGGARWAGPICKDGQVVNFHANWGLFRPFPVDMAAFAVNIKKLILDFPKAKFIALKRPGMLESSLLRQITTVKELEPVTQNCSKVYVWHTRTETPKDSILGERGLIKKGTPSDRNVET
ncbi:galactosylgalactosylxylosylprotein 3-beta-glucuronosyltransferase 3-like [Acropora muricata]|uniref:galactosylgalactosylxylosylprotein 3-beta-glucuronosyltransferase 3-like n=1 Tax=Acropora muricata TaxID=159855 RepID=UPI0034E4D22F